MSLRKSYSSPNEKAFLLISKLKRHWRESKRSKRGNNIFCFLSPFFFASFYHLSSFFHYRTNPFLFALILSSPFRFIESPSKPSFLLCSRLFSHSSLLSPTASRTLSIISQANLLIFEFLYQIRSWHQCIDFTLILERATCVSPFFRFRFRFSKPVRKCDFPEQLNPSLNLPKLDVRNRQTLWIIYATPITFKVGLFLLRTRVAENRNERHLLGWKSHQRKKSRATAMRKMVSWLLVSSLSVYDGCSLAS